MVIIKKKYVYDEKRTTRIKIVFFDILNESLNILNVLLHECNELIAMKLIRLTEREYSFLIGIYFKSFALRMTIEN